ncbi:flagellar export chaperone FliS [Phycisphaerales bacterium AB-hyl4]|uniref:Flagellar export chaperone FliS n=1 Tax=Natronomicrosphaera hydrolytica TaxID=3242702 RepID=A0ABV4U6L6_9BACT
MPAPATNPYLRTKIMTASPEQLRLMLYDGAIKFCRQGRDAIGRQDFEGSYTALSRAQKIVLELSSSLKHDADPELCKRLAALYTYIYRRLVDANTTRDLDAIDEAIRLIEYERETWQMVIRKAAVGDDTPTPPSVNPYAAGTGDGVLGRLSHSA